jgi:hypothetical protein
MYNNIYVLIILTHFNINFLKKDKNVLTYKINLIIIISVLRDWDIEYDNIQYYDNIISVVKTEKYFAIKS